VRLLPRRRPKIERLKQAGDVEGLRALLDHRDLQPATDGALWDMAAPVRAQAVAALAELEDERAMEGLAHALADSSPAVRSAALEAIAALPEPTADAALVDAIVAWPYPEHEDALERAVAILVDWGREGPAGQVVERLLAPEAPALDDRHEDALTALLDADPRGDAARTELADSLTRELERPASAERAARAERILAWLGRAGADRVVQALERADPSTGMIRAAGVLREARAVEPLVRLLSGAEPPVRAAAASALGAVNDTRAVQALMGATQDPEPAVRDAASGALDGMGMAAVIVGVASVMRDTMREQLAAGQGEDALPEPIAPAAPEAGLPAPATTPVPPTWTQEVLGRLLRRAGGTR